MNRISRQGAKLEGSLNQTRIPESTSACALAEKGALTTTPDGQKNGPETFPVQKLKNETVGHLGGRDHLQTTTLVAAKEIALNLISSLAGNPKNGRDQLRDRVIETAVHQTAGQRHGQFQIVGARSNGDHIIGSQDRGIRDGRSQITRR